jgi:hypothetical protein
VRLSLRPEDRALAPAYAQTLAVRLETVEIIEGTGDAPARFVATVTEDAAQPICGLPDLALSETLAEGLMARQPAVEETD